MVYLLLVLTAIIWGGTFVAAKVVVAELHPLVAASTRYVLAFLILLPFMIYAEGRRARIAVKDIPLLAALGTTGIFLYNAFFFGGLQWTSATNGSLLVATGPSVTAILSALFLKERLTLTKVVGLVMSLIGVIIIVTSGSLGVLVNLRFNVGDLMLAVSTTSWSVYSVLGKIAGHRHHPITSTTYAFGFGALLLTLFAVPHWSAGTLSHFTPVVIYCLLFMAVLASAVCFVIWFHGIRKIGASRAAIFQNIVPVSAAALAILFLDERLRAFHVIGAILVLGGVSLVTGVFTRSSRDDSDDFH
jgi:drug/metabolite transporter (DMT)-like permease